MQSIEESKLFPSTIIIMDEVHRLNKDKQDLLLPYVESGEIYLIGATTSNPYIAINPAIRSRCHLLEVKSLTTENVVNGLKRRLQSPKSMASQSLVSDFGGQKEFQMLSPRLLM